MSKELLVVLDRDGVINEDSDQYVKNADEWIPLPGSIEAIARLKQLGYLVAVVTNQSGLARGYFDEFDLAAMHYKFFELLEDAGSDPIDLLLYCPHGPDEGCECRKPKPGMLDELIDQLGLEGLEGVWMVGDSLRDLQAGVQRGMQPVLVRTGKGLKTESGQLPDNTLVFDNLKGAVDELISRKG